MFHIISRKKLRTFWETHAKAQPALEEWYRVVKKATWKKFTDVRKTYRTADAVNQFVVFNIAGNNYRLIAFVDYERGKLFVRHVLTRAEYDRDTWKADTFGQGNGA